MKVHEIAKLCGLEKEQVAAELGITAEGKYWMQGVDDAPANAFLVSKGVQPPETPEVDQPPPQPKKGRSARFWSPKRAHYFPASDDAERGDIQFKDWIYETERDGPEAAFLRIADVQNRTGILEVLDKPYTDVEVAVEFELFLDSLIFSGADRSDGPSREGMRMVRAFLRGDELGEMDTVNKNSSTALKKAVRMTKSTNRVFVAGE